MECIPWTPDATLAIDISFETFADGLAAYIKTAERFLMGTHLQVAYGAPLLRLEDIRFSTQIQVRESQVIRVCLPHGLQLIVICGHFHSGKRPG